MLGEPQPCRVPDERTGRVRVGAVEHEAESRVTAVPFATAMTTTGGGLGCDRPINACVHPTGLPISTPKVEVLRRPIESTVYTSADYRTLVNDLGMRSSMGRTGVCWDNAIAESFFSAVKNERVDRTVYATKAQTRRDVIAYIEGFYNSRRRHSTLGYKRPNEVHYRYHQPVTAA